MSRRRVDLFDDNAPGTQRREQPVTGEKRRLHAVFILDRSSSMSSVRRATVNAFNGQLNTLKSLAEQLDIRASLVTFSTSVDPPVVWEAELPTIEPLSLQSYRPAGKTALYDAVGQTITQLRGQIDVEGCPDSFLVIIVSDGKENASVEWRDTERLSHLCTEVQGTGRWTLVYLGCNIDLAEIMETLSIPKKNIRGYADGQNMIGRGLTIDVEAGLSRYVREVSSGRRKAFTDFFGEP